jgi:hypothetical protein
MNLDYKDYIIYTDAPTQFLKSWIQHLHNLTKTVARTVIQPIQQFFLVYSKVLG